MKSMLLALLLIFNVQAQEQMNQKYECAINKSEVLKVFEVEKERSVEISIAIKHFLYGEAEVIRLMHPNIIRYGNVMMVSENYGRSGYIFMRFEENQNMPDSVGNVLGLIDDNRFNPQYSLGYSPGHLSVLADCKKVE
jgi:hypothetical protein